MTKQKRRSTERVSKRVGEMSETEVSNLKKLKIGQYISITTENMIISFEVRLDEETIFPCERQVDAEILSRLVRIERLLRQKRR